MMFLFWCRVPALEFILLVFFGFAKEAKKEYETVRSVPLEQRLPRLTPMDQLGRRRLQLPSCRYLPGAYTLSNEYRRMIFFWSTTPASAFIFCIFFGFGKEAKKEYKKVWAWVKKNVLRGDDGHGKGRKKLWDLLPTSAGSAFSIFLPLPIKSYINDLESKSIICSPTTPTSVSNYALTLPTPPMTVLVIEPTAATASRTLSDSWHITPTLYTSLRSNRSYQSHSVTRNQALWKRINLDLLPDIVSFSLLAAIAVLG